jgi:hypothetical protein
MAAAQRSYAIISAKLWLLQELQLTLKAHKTLLRLNTDISPNPFRDEPSIISRYRKVMEGVDRKKGGGI